MSEFIENWNNAIGCQLQLNLMCKPNIKRSEVNIPRFFCY